MKSIRRFFPRRYVLPLAMLSVTSFVALLVLLWYLTAIQNRQDVERDRIAIASALDGILDFAVHDLQDYSIWDDAARHLLGGFDRQWADDNISVYLGARQGYQHVFVVEDDRKTIYSYENGQSADVPLDAVAAIGPAILYGITDANRPGIRGQEAIGGFSHSTAGIFAYAASALTALTPSPDLSPGPPRTLIIAMLLDEQALAQMASRYRLGTLRIVGPEGVLDTEEAVVLTSRDGTSVGQLAWMPERPGTVLLYRILPGLFIIGAIATTAAATVLNRARRADEELTSSRVNIQHLAYHDALTGLANRRRFQDVLREGGAGPNMQILYMDLDGFKEANDVYGHAMGDALLIEAARRIGAAAPEDALVARTGGDEFAILMPGREGEPRQTCDGVLRAFDPAFEVRGYSVNIGVTVGAASGAEGLEGEELMRRADVAMYAAKSRGKRGWLAYNTELDAANQVRHVMEGALREALDNDLVRVVFQPIVSAGTGRIEMVEALARWNHPQLGEVPPDQFIRVAEQSGLINALGRRVLAHACAAAKAWPIRISVNLSPVEFWDRDLVGSIHRVLDQAGFPSSRLDLEITERHLLRRPDEAAAILSEFRMRGIRISLDDFGTGYSSIGYLQRLSIDRIKMDRSFVQAAERGGKGLRMAAAVVKLGQALDLPVTAEGVETPAQAALMREIGCSHLQGWLFGHGMCAEEITAALERQNGEVPRR